MHFHSKLRQFPIIPLAFRPALTPERARR